MKHCIDRCIGLYCATSLSQLRLHVDVIDSRGTIYILFYIYIFNLYIHIYIYYLFISIISTI